MLKKIGRWLARDEIKEKEKLLADLLSKVSSYNDRLEEVITELAAAHRAVGDNSDSASFKLKQHARAEALEELLALLKKDTN